ncbi:MAG: phage Gp37/Gp68 family protein [Candidatus Thiodiazotropha sp. (ex Lucinoma kastoroae)]|nr:phage Gp37/Gp68 family protein [Candidatus Thiodiazotropha sp. (ex Lucinoma kastoroae)]MCU7858514.1 phage Gp37/Gp68 family protein [Candidatus Thiodiazotropha sp. (ex Lucinoma kastoroae)]
MSRIEWTEKTWNPVTGCTKISPGCKHCYAEAMAKRLCAMGTAGYENGFKLSLHPNRLFEPLKRKKRTTYFVNSMSDLFHQKVPLSFIESVFVVIQRCPHHNFQILTKRPERMKSFISKREVLKNCWLGTTVEDRKYGIPRIDILREIQAPIKFLSVEPLLEDLGELDFSNIHWVIVGGESGPKARPMQVEWVESIRDQCREQNVSFFFKQWGGWGADGVRRPKAKNGRMLNGRTWDEIPEVRAV